MNLPDNKHIDERAGSLINSSENDRMSGYLTDSTLPYSKNMISNVSLSRLRHTPRYQQSSEKQLKKLMQFIKIRN